jgi:hypothetical protein
MVEKTEEKVPLEKCTHKWENNFKMDIRKIWREVLDRLHIFRDTVRRKNCPNTVDYIFKKSSVFWDITACIQVKVSGRFGGEYHLNIQV